MKDKETLYQISEIASSPKRLLVLYIISQDSFCGYTRIMDCFKKYNIPISSSEVYKHIHILNKFRLIRSKERKFVATGMGIRFINGIKCLLEREEKGSNNGKISR